MPILTSPCTRIEIPVADKIFADTVIKQKATFTSLTHLQLETGECVASIVVVVRCYATEAGVYGMSLHDMGVPDRFITLCADNNCLVDATTGAILAVRTTETNKEWSALADSFTQDVMHQGDFFEVLRENQVVIADLIRHHIAQADAMGRFK